MTILAVGPHPDDVEFGCAALLIQEARKQHRVKILLLSRGEAGSSGSPEQRERESREAARLMGAEIQFLDLGGDCHIRHTPENAILLARELRREKPAIVLAPLAGKIGFHADFPLDRFLAASGLVVRETRPSNLFGYWKLLRCVNLKPG
jgi:LmbE family N-acetylglucosaminyl deacetylase